MLFDKNLIDLSIDFKKWFDNLDICFVSNLSKDHLHLIPVYKKKNKFLILSDILENEFKLKIEKFLISLNADSITNILFNINNYNFILNSSDMINKISLAGYSRQLGLDFASFLKKYKFDNIAIHKHEYISNFDLLDGIISGLYNTDQFKSKNQTKVLNKINIIDNKKNIKIKDKLELFKHVYICRFLQDTPANICNPDLISDFIINNLENKNTDINIKGRDDLSKLGMNALLSVAQGSKFDPKMITMKIKGINPSKTILFIGKGITFDSGGISLKPSNNMSEMKYDMSGSAIVTALGLLLSKVQPYHNVICLSAFLENMPDSNSVKPGDIVKSYSGKTIEIDNTDAEGRLVLADLISYGEDKFKPDYIIDIATLTGAVIYAIGNAGSAIMGNDKDLSSKIIDIGSILNEKYCHLPFWSEYKKEVKGSIADLNNITNPKVKAGSIMAGMFLNEFIKNTKWAHIDIASTAWDCSAAGYPRKGSSGFGLRTLFKLSNLKDL
jgi:leucyl aminopeptidase